jgi:hypothetical protein
MKYTWLWLALLVCVQGQSQNLTLCEYFFDTDPGLGNGIVIPTVPADSLIITTTVPTSSLTPGFHKLFVRTMDADGIWSLYEGRTLYIQTNTNNTNAQLTEAEYFYDTDPGIGNGTNFSVTANDSLIIDTTVPTTSLTPGFHKLYTRAKNANGVWSLSEWRTVYVQLPNAPDDVILTEAEYFYDTDPGIGNATAFSITPDDSLSFNASQDITSLQSGFHKLFVRAKSSEGKWSLYEWRTFFIDQEIMPDTLDLVAAEYYFDTEPGLGLGEVLDVTPGDSIDANFTVPQSLALGAHTMFLRVQSENGDWSLFEARTFDISVGIEELNAMSHALLQNYPNPFNQTTQLEFYLSQPDDVQIEITDISGKLVRTIPLRKLNSGQHKIVIDASDLSEGMYSYRMITPTYTESKQMLLLR